ncbi:hypothetical protein ASD54_08695 [Rhizobium sp. Root149]|uniref:phage tail tube protein n=1 Tax=Rhizobium sp. Root149 TaxID=1736473 RepID=UPI0007162442|nr:hypothetical protein [Rhizobium sp. Root149]KQZ50323.1 hypothetical protein ASD54_08695 [Rhizobium sp. Root149]
MAQIFQPDYDSYVHQSAQARFQPRGKDYAESLGDIETAPMTIALTDISRYSREGAEKVLAAVKTIQKETNFTMTIFSLNRTTAALYFMDDLGAKLVQTAVTSETITFQSPKVKRSYNLGKRKVTIISIDDGGDEPITFVRDVHYKLNSETGDIEIIAVPEGATQIEVTFSAAAITAQDDIGVYGLVANQGSYGKITFYGTHDDGFKYQVELWNCRITTTSIQLQGTDDFVSLELNVQVLADGTQPPQFRYAKITELKD